VVRASRITCWIKRLSYLWQRVKRQHLNGCAVKPITRRRPVSIAFLVQPTVAACARPARRHHVGWFEQVSPRAAEECKVELHREVDVAKVEADVLSSASQECEPRSIGGTVPKRPRLDSQRRYPPNQHGSGLIFLPENLSPSGNGLSHRERNTRASLDSTGV
jgi:hypothetical protein